MKLTLPDRLRSRLRRAYTLMEVLAASAVVGIGMTAAVSLSSTLMIQEELSWRVAVVRNYQENMGRLWQLGIRAEDVMNIMPRHTDSPMLNQVINGTPVIIQTGATTASGLGSMQAAAVTAAVNISMDPAVKRQGAALTFSVYRPKLPTDLRPAAP
jgi:prepilin-type N-terminal cleavage/methylation domain-containing protein